MVELEVEGVNCFLMFIYIIGTYAFFQVKVSHESSLNRSCAMCGNYERQLQKMQDENQKFQNLASNLQVALDQEKVRDKLKWP